MKEQTPVVIAEDQDRMKLRGTPDLRGGSTDGPRAYLATLARRQTWQVRQIGHRPESGKRGCSGPIALNFEEVLDEMARGSAALLVAHGLR